MKESQSFTVLLDEFVHDDGRHIRQLAQEIGQQFGDDQMVPHNTISRWRRGVVKKPRNWSDIVKLATVLRLEESRLNALLQAAGHPSLEQLRQLDSDFVPNLFAFWLSPQADWLPPFQAPPQLTNFVGRTEVIAQLSRYLTSQSLSRVCCLLGMAGLGKTSLAIHLAYLLRSQFTDGVLWLRLDQTDTLSALHSIAAAYDVDVSSYADVETRSVQVRQLLAQKEALLILDNAEDDALLRPLLPSNGRCAVMVTCRRHDLASLDEAYRVTLSPFDVSQGESLHLLQAVLGTAQIAPAYEQWQAVAERLGHLPLALAIVAHRWQHEPGWTVEELDDRLLQHPLSLLQRGDRAVRLSFKLSYERLDEEERSIFTALAVFGGFDFEAKAVAAVVTQPLPEVADGLRRLYNLSLLQVQANGRYQLHPLLAEFAAEFDQAARFRLCYINYYLIHYLTLNKDKPARLGLESQHILAALAQAHVQGRDGLLLSAVLMLYPYWQSQGQLSIATTWLLVAEKAARAIKKDEELTAVLNHQGYTAMKQGEPQQAEAYYAEALGLARQTEDGTQLVDLLMKLGALAHRCGHYGDARAFYEEGLGQARCQQAQSQTAAFLANLGLITAVEGDPVKATAYYEEALPITRQVTNHPMTIAILQNLGSLIEERGDYAQAKSHYTEGLQLAETINDPELRSRMLGNLGLIACQLGHYAEAAAHFRAGLALAEQSDLTLQHCRQQANLGYVAVKRGVFSKAEFHYQASLALARTMNFPEDLSVILNQMGECYWAQQDFIQAATYFNEAQEVAMGANLQREIALSLYGLARLAAQRGNVVEARRLGHESQQILQGLKHRQANEVWWWLKELPGEANGA